MFPKSPYRKGGRYFQLRNDGLQNQFVLCMFDGLEDEPTVLLDPNTLSSDGSTALANWSVSEDGRWLVYATSTGGLNGGNFRARRGINKVQGSITAAIRPPARGALIWKSTATISSIFTHWAQPNRRMN